MNRKRRYLLILISVLIIVSLIVYLFAEQARAPSPENEQNQEQTDETGNVDTEEDFNKQRYSLDDPTSPWVVVNRERPLPDSFVPSELVVPEVQLRLDHSAEQMQISHQAAPALEEMFAAAQADGVELVFGSGYRSVSLQAEFYNSYVEREGRAAADRYSARPGTSEHQTGLAADITSPDASCHLEICFADTPQGQWVAENAHRYGFIVRYPDGKEDITGYQYEPWHLRYVGPELAQELHESGQTMEEFFNLANG